jgi:hypothetical protein
MLFISCVFNPAEVKFLLAILFISDLGKFKTFAAYIA